MRTPFNFGKENKLWLILLFVLWTEASVYAQNPELYIETGHEDRVTGGKFSPDGKFIVSGGEGEKIKLWDAETGQELLQIEGSVNSRSVTMESPFAFSRDEKLFVADSSSGDIIKLWDTETWQEIPKNLRRTNVSEEASPLEQFAISPNNEYLAAADYDGNVFLWDLNSGEEVKSLASKTKTSELLAFTNNGELLVDDPESGITLWGIENGEKSKTLEDCSIGSPFSYNGAEAIAGKKSKVTFGRPPNFTETDVRIVLCDLISGKEYKQFQADAIGSIEKLTFSGDGKSISAFSNKGITKIWNILDFGNKAELQTIKLPSGEPGFSFVQSLALNSEGSRLAAGDLDGTITVIDVKSGQVLNKLKKYISNFRALGLNRVGYNYTVQDLNLFASGNLNDVRLWKNERQLEQVTFKGHTETVNVVRINPDKKLLASAGDDKTIRIWDVSTGNSIFTLKGHTSGIFTIEFSPDGKILVSTSAAPYMIVAGENDETLKIWDVASGKLIRSYPRWDDARTEQAVSKLVPGFYEKFNEKPILPSGDGKIVPALRENGRLSFLKTGGHEEIVSLIALGENEWVAVSPDGRFDTNKSLDRIEGLHWNLPDEPLRAFPLEIFMRQYYEPGLLYRKLKCTEEGNCDQEFKPLPAISELNHVQPEIVKLEVSELKPNGRVDVKVEIKTVTEKIKQKNEEILSSGVFDLKLFRDGQLVGSSTPKEFLEKYIKNVPRLVKEEEEYFKSTGKLINTPEDIAWREANDLSKVVKFENGKAVYTFKNIKLPQNRGKEIEFSAYAFNADRVKGNTLRTIYRIKSL